MTSICPFCGTASDVPHETQEGCIDALRAEVARTRELLQQITEPLPPPVVAADDEAQVT